MRQKTCLWCSVALIVTLMAMSGCGSGLTNANGSLLTSMTVTTANPFLAPGASQQFSAIGAYEDNTTQDITNQVTWTSSDTDKATISNTGLATAVAEGTASITASFAWVNNTVTMTITAAETGTGINDTIDTATPIVAPATRQDSLFDHNGVHDIDFYSLSMENPGQIFIGVMEGVARYNLLDFDVIDVNVALYDSSGNVVPTGNYWPYYYFTLMGELRMPAWYTEAIVPAGTYYIGVFSDTGAQGIYDVFIDSYPWLPTSLIDAPSARAGHAAVWTGTEMIAWGGDQLEAGSGIELKTGARYDPDMDSWASMTTENAPLSSPSQPAVWTGSELLTWGSHGGARYNPANNVWTSITTTNAPTYISQRAIWTGTDMIVAPGTGSLSDFVPGSRYNLVNDTWTPINTENTPVCSVKCEIVWTGTEMLTWEGHAVTGSRYDPQTDTWTAISTENAPSSRSVPFVFWTGKEMIVWGGWDPTQVMTKLSSGAKYDPATDTWTPISMDNAPISPNNLNAAWIGTEMITWGYTSDGSGNPVYEGQGGSYNPDSDTWTVRETRNAPTVPSGSTVIWTGSEIVIWGGMDIVMNGINTGARWVP